MAREGAGVARLLKTAGDLKACFARLRVRSDGLDRGFVRGVEKTKERLHVDIHEVWVLFNCVRQQAQWLTGQPVRHGQSPVYRPFA